MVLKRALDLSLAFIALVCLSIPFCFIAILVKASSPGPVLFWSERMGRDNKPFLMPKFRTMKVGTPLQPTDELEDAATHITAVGRMLRTTSLDELPQLYSVINGDMSLVGPRPVILSQQDLIHRRTAAGVHKIRPGITGWAQINGRDAVSLSDKVELDAEYARRASVGFDCVILCKTIYYVLARQGVMH